MGFGYSFGFGFWFRFGFVFAPVSLRFVSLRFSSRPVSPNFRAVFDSPRFVPFLVRVVAFRFSFFVPFRFVPFLVCFISFRFFSSLRFMRVSFRFVLIRSVPLFAHYVFPLPVPAIYGFCRAFCAGTAKHIVGLRQRCHQVCGVAAWNSRGFLPLQ